MGKPCPKPRTVSGVFCVLSQQKTAATRFFSKVWETTSSLAGILTFPFRLDFISIRATTTSWCPLRTSHLTPFVSRRLESTRAKPAGRKPREAADGRGGGVVEDQRVGQLHPRQLIGQAIAELHRLGTQKNNRLPAAFPGCFSCGGRGGEVLRRKSRPACVFCAGEGRFWGAAGPFERVDRRPVLFFFLGGVPLEIMSPKKGALFARHRRFGFTIVDQLLRWKG